MKVKGKSLVFSFIVISFLILTLYPSASALTVRLDPMDVERAPGNQVRIFIWADDAVDLISMGVKVSYEPTLLQAVGASKYEDVTNGWVLTDGVNQYTTPVVDIDNTIGFVRMIGGHFTGAATVGHSGPVLLGWIDFQASSDIEGTSALTVDLAQDSPNFLHFVRADGTPDEPSNISSGGVVLGNIYVGVDACESRIAEGDTYVNFNDLDLLKSQFFLVCSTLPPGQVCTADLDGDGLVNFGDLDLMKADFFRNCP